LQNWEVTCSVIPLIWCVTWDQAPNNLIYELYE
jgi:hypothetical protein